MSEQIPEGPPAGLLGSLSCAFPRWPKGFFFFLHHNLTKYYYPNYEVTKLLSRHPPIFVHLIK